MGQYNRKGKHYKEWLRLREIESNIPWSYEKTKEEGEIENELNKAKFIKFRRFYDNPPKWFIRIFNKSDRQHNKQALKINLKFLDDDMGDYINYRYNNRNSAKWFYW